MFARGRRTAVPVIAALALLGLAACGSTTGAATTWTEPAAATSGASAGTPGASSSPSAGPSASPSAGASPSATLTANLAAVRGKVIVIDPGHNGGNASHTSIINQQVPMGTGTKACDTTGTETNAGYPEHAFTFDVATRLVAILKAAGATVIMTHTTDTGVGPCVNVRAQIGNDNHADVALSIHGDGAPASGHGFHVMEPEKVGAPSDAIIDTSHQLALKIRDNYRAYSGVPASNYIGSNGIDPRGDMGGMNLSVVPKVMIECGNMRNSGDAAIMTNATYRQKMAQGLAAGIAAYLASK